MGMKRTMLLLGAAVLLVPSSGLLSAQESGPALSGLFRSAGPGYASAVPPIGNIRTAPPAARTGDPGVDLSGQFPTGSRDQADVGACHVFASIALLEAAYYRRHGEKARFSEADLFLRNTVLNGNIYSGDLLDRGYTWNGKPELKEGGGATTILQKGDLEFAIQNGVATTPQYEAFVERYRQYREAEQRTLADIERQRQRDPWYVRLLYNPRKHWARMQKSPLNQRILQNYLMGNDATIDAQREETRRKLQGFSVARDLFITLPSAFNKSQDDCRRDGQKRTAAIMNELQAGRPVAISYYTDADWGSHVLIVQGYSSDGSGGLVFKTRNSWGSGGNFDMFPHDMCKVHGVVSVRE